MALLPTTRTEILAVLRQTDRQTLESDGLFHYLLRSELPQAPDYLDLLWSELNVHVNFLYGDPLLMLLESLRDQLMGVTISACKDRDNISPSATEETALALSNQLYLSTLSDQPLIPRSTVPRVVQGEWLLSPEIETIMSNGWRIFDLLLQYGLNQEQLEYLTEEDAAHYVTPLLELFRRSTVPRIREYALEVMTQLFPLGLDMYTDVIFLTLRQLLQDGANKTLADLTEPIESFETNFIKIIQLLNALLAAGFDINYAYQQPLMFPESYGVVTHESEGQLRLETVTYIGCTVTALATIYNRADVLSWILQFTGPLPIEEVDEEVTFTARRLDPRIGAFAVDDEAPRGQNHYLSLVVNLKSSLSKEESEDEKCELLQSAPVEPNQEYENLALSLRHRSFDCHQLLVEYDQLLESKWFEFDPCLQDLNHLVLLF